MMWTNIAVFYTDLGEDGWAKVDRIHHQPSKLDHKTLEGAVICSPNSPPDVKEGWSTSLWVNPTTGSVEWRIKPDLDYRMPASDLLSLLPSQARISARSVSDTDPIVQDFLSLIDMSVADSSSKGFHPASSFVKDGLAHLVSLGFMTQAEVELITEP